MTIVIMKRRLRLLSAFTVLFVILPLTSALALDEAGRLWLVGEHAFADGLYPLARRTLEKLVEQFPGDTRLPGAVLLLGRSRLAVGDAAAALEAFRRAQTMQPPPGTPGEPKFWKRRRSSGSSATPTRARPTTPSSAATRPRRSPPTRSTATRGASSSCTGPSPR